MPIKLILVFVLLLLSARPAGAQWYDPASGQSPMVLMDVPADGVAYYEVKERARALYDSSQWAEAEPLIERLVREYPRDPENWTMLGRTRFRLRKFREAAEAWERAGPLTGGTWSSATATAPRRRTRTPGTGRPRWTCCGG